MSAATYTLNKAYHLDQVQRDHAGAIALIRERRSDPHIDAALKTRMYELRDIISARSLGLRSGAHVEKICLDLLSEALASPR
jgi:hypothetical protein